MEKADIWACYRFSHYHEKELFTFMRRWLPDVRIEVIPDFIPGVGFVDDVFVIGMVMKSISEEIVRYKAFKDMEE